MLEGGCDEVTSVPGADRVGCDGSLTANYYSHVALYMCECTSLNLRDCLTSWVVLHEHCVMCHHLSPIVTAGDRCWGLW